MKSRIIPLLLFLAAGMDCWAQESPQLTEEPGTFKMLNRTDFTAPDCGFTKADMTANLGRITFLVSVVRQNPVLSDFRSLTPLIGK